MASAVACTRLAPEARQKGPGALFYAMTKDIDRCRQMRSLFFRVKALLFLPCSFFSFGCGLGRRGLDRVVATAGAGEKEESLGDWLVDTSRLFASFFFSFSQRPGLSIRAQCQREPFFRASISGACVVCL
nr:hypothetical protein [Pandoravirus aubagnensis]